MRFHYTDAQLKEEICVDSEMVSIHAYTHAVLVGKNAGKAKVNKKQENIYCILICISNFSFLKMR